MPHWNFKKAVNETCFIQLVYSLVRVSSAKITVQSLESRRFCTAFHTKKTTNCVWKIKWELHENALECECITTSLWRYWHCPRGMRSRVYVTIGCPSVWSIVQQPLRRAAGLLPSAPRTEHIDRQRRQPAPSSTAPSSTALSSKCRQCLVDSRVGDTEHRLVLRHSRTLDENKQYSEI